jgi:rhodanese-related sulfurtransferase
MKRFLKYIWLILGVSVFNCQTAPHKNVTVVPVEEFNALLNDKTIQLIDVRTPKEFEDEHIENAININFFDEDFTEKINKLNKEKPVYIYCRSGKRSGSSSEVFLKAGFIHIYDLEGGILNWKSEGFKVSTKK